MQRVFLKDVGRNFKAGEMRDYPGNVWNDIARQEGTSLEEITRAVEDLARAAPEPAPLRKRKGG